MKNLAKGIVALMVLLLLTAGCGGSPIDDSGKERVAELEARGFQQIKLESAHGSQGFMHGVEAVANASVGNCRFRLEWDEGSDWILTDDGKPVKVPGELTAAGILRLPQYRQCAAPAPRG